MTSRIVDCQISTLNLSNENLKNLRYFGVTDLITGALPQPHQTQDSLFLHFQKVIEDAHRARQFDLKVYPTLGFRGKAPIRAGGIIYHEIEKLIHAHNLIAIGPIGITENTPESWKAFKAQVEIAQNLQKPVIITAPSPTETTLMHLMVKQLKEYNFPLSKSLFCVSTLTSAELLLLDGVKCAISPSEIKDENFHFHPLYSQLLLASKINAPQEDILAIPRSIEYLQKIKSTPTQFHPLFFMNMLNLFNVS